MRAAIGLSITIILLLLLYGGGYCLMLKGRYVEFLGNNRIGPEEPYYVIGSMGEPHNITQRIARAVFLPANAIDKRIRPSEWKGPGPLPLARPEDVESNPR